MTTLTIDILNDKALDLIKDLELLQIIRVRNNTSEIPTAKSWIEKYKGAMTPRTLAEVDKQLEDMRNEWD